MNHALNLEVERVDGALLRVIGMTERRGWSTVSMHAESDDAAATLRLRLTVLGSRSIELLVRQLRKLYVVREVEVLE